MRINNPYLYHPHPLCKAAASDLCETIAARPEWEKEFAKGKMLGVLVVENSPLARVHYLNNKEHGYLAAFSGIVAIEANDFFVPPVYDLNNPEDFYKEEEKRISAINKEIEELSDPKKVEGLADLRRIEALKTERKNRSQALQLEIFRHFDFVSHNGERRNILDIFADAKRGLPPGGAGECAAPRLLQYAFTHGLKPVAMAEFWYGLSPRRERRIHKQFYPSCIEKCSPILKFMIGTEGNSLKNNSHKGNFPSPDIPKILYEDEDLIVLEKTAEVLSVPAKDLSLFNVESWLHETHPDVKGPMLVHRLDQSTSGLMIAAKNAATFKALQQGFLDHSIRKTYLAWVDGDLPSECGVINLPICPNPDDRPRQVVDHQFGKKAITRYKVLKREKNIADNGNEESRTLLALYPFTGRTHQLRLHCASPFGLDHAILGDRIYKERSDENAREKLDTPHRLMLHAAKISFTHPTTLKTVAVVVGERSIITLD